MTELAICGGEPVIPEPLQLFKRIGKSERKAAERVLSTGLLSGFIGAPGPDFDGGQEVQALEAAWRKKFGVDHAISVNSATSGLYAAMGAAGIGPGDEVIVPPYTMSATAIAPLVYGAAPLFCDIEEETFCIDPEQVRQAISPRTKAIIAVNLFGHPARLHELRSLADEHGILLVEDNAQGPLALEKERLAGTIGHIGVFSLNRHKHIQTGEGGICTTDDENLALRLRLIRNHGENLVEHFGINDAKNLIGFNYRLTELSAAIGLSQLEKSEEIIAERERHGQRLSQALSGLSGLTPPVVRSGCRHVYYAWPARFSAEAAGVSRDAIARALAAEGVPVNQGYVEPLYLLPIFRDREAPNGQDYRRGLCPVCEQMHYQEELGFGICAFELSDKLIDRIAEAFFKVFENREALRRLEPEA